MHLASTWPCWKPSNTRSRQLVAVFLPKAVSVLREISSGLRVQHSLPPPEILTFRVFHTKPNVTLLLRLLRDACPASAESPRGSKLFITTSTYKFRTSVQQCIHQHSRLHCIELSESLLLIHPIFLPTCRKSKSPATPFKLSRTRSSSSPVSRYFVFASIRTDCEKVVHRALGSPPRSWLSKQVPRSS